MKKIILSTLTCLLVFPSISFANIPRIKITDLKNNMSVLQKTLENYATGSGGVFPEDVNNLIAEAKNGSYWKKIKNPFNNREGVGKNGSLLNYKEYNPKGKMGGLVLYEGTDCNGGICSGYKIYGTDIDGRLIEFQGQPFTFSN